jgi:hypothetical protein
LTLHTHDRVDHGCDFRTREAWQLDLGCQPFTVERGQKSCQLWPDLVAAIGQQQSNPVRPNVPCQCQQYRKTGIIAPMQILDDQAAKRGLNELTVRAKERETAHQSMRQLTLILCGVNSRRLSVGQQLGKLRQ